MIRMMQKSTILRRLQTRAGVWSRRVKSLRAVDVLSLGVSIGTVGWLFLLDWTGERFPLSAFALLLPPLFWCFPAAAAGALALLLRRWSAAAPAAVLAYIFFFYMDFELPRLHFSTPHRPTVSLVTNNTGQNAGTSPAEFIRREDPDVILFQERQFFEGVPPPPGPWHRVLVGEFAVWSRLPVVSHRIVEVPCSSGKNGRWRAAVRVELELDDGARIAVYNVHLPSPRQGIELLRGEGFRVEAFRLKGVLSTQTWRAFQRLTQARLEAARGLRAILDGERLPWIAAGDFNMPDHGVQYRLFAGQCIDTFEYAGFGYGFTFPGKTRTRLWPFGPWLRLDYVFCSRHWRPMRAVVERGRPSQHHAVGARLVLDARETGD